MRGIILRGRRPSDIMMRIRTTNIYVIKRQNHRFGYRSIISILTRYAAVPDAQLN
jgi:hypothetical protein